jgi:hypothetical protein
LVTVPPPPPNADVYRGLEASPTGEVILMSNSTPAIVRVKSGRITTIDLESPLYPETPTGLGFIDGIGFVLGGREGGIAVDPGDGRWHLLGNWGSPSTAYGFVAFPGGALLGGPLGNMVQYASASGSFCASQHPVSFGVRHLVPLGSGILVGGTNAGVGMTSLALLQW